MKVLSIVILAFVVAIIEAGGEIKSTSCDGRCGENDGSSGCQCDAGCTDYGTCCSDYEEACLRCEGRCGADYVVIAPCQCNDECSAHNNCCDDFDVCLTCEGRCGDEYVANAPCHCNDACPAHSNCCDDYDELCDGGGTGTITDDDIRALTEELSTLDSNNLGSEVVIDMQGQTTNSDHNDVAPNPLMSFVPELTAETIVLFETLRDNYERSESVAEDNTEAEQGEVSVFLDAVMATPLMVRLEEFMTEKQVLSGSLRENIAEAWFTLYSRSGSTLGSTGFEHSFIGEVSGGSVGGFHNWISYYREEQAGNSDYKGYIEYADLGDSGVVLTSRFTWYEANKPIGGFIIGTSPEYDLAIFTLCFFTRPNRQCSVQTNGVQYFIQTYEMKYDGLTLVASAYPVV